MAKFLSRQNVCPFFNFLASKYCGVFTIKIIIIIIIIIVIIIITITINCFR